MTAATDSGELIATWLRTRYPVDGDPFNPLPTLLAEALDASETGIDVDDGTKFVAGDVILVDTEQMNVTAVSGNTLTVTRAYNSSTAATHADNSEIGVFRSRRFKLAQPLQPQAVDGFPGKVTIGAYNIDSNDILSAWVISNLTGGHGIAEHDEGVTDNRYRFGNIYTRYTSQWTKSFEAKQYALGTGSVFFLGDLFYNDLTYRMATSGLDLYQSAANRGAITGQPVNMGVQYRGTAAQSLFYVPESLSGYSTFNPATNVVTNNNAAGDPDVRAFAKFDEKLLALEKDGSIHYATAAAATTTFTPYTLGGNNLALDDAFVIRNMLVFYNRQGDSVPYVITGGEVWAFDADTPRFYQIPDFGSIHPRFGYASTVWRGELYVSSGMDILAFNGEVIRNVGLSRDDGLPYLYQGHVVSFTPGQNALYALVQGVTTGGVTYHSIHEWSGFGWHCLHTLNNALVPRNIVLSSEETGGIALHDMAWGMSNTGIFYKIVVPTSFTNPREAIDNDATILFGYNPTGSTLESYYLETGRFDANMKGYRKLASSVEMDVRTMPADNSIVLKYRIDDDTAWTTMYHTDGVAPSGTTVTTTGHHLFEFGPYDPNGHFIGIDFESIEFRLEFIDTATTTKTPAVTSIVFSFLKLMNPSLAWTANIDLVEAYHDASPQVLLDELTELRTLPHFFSIKHKARTYRARMTGQQSVELGGQEEAASAQMSLIEIPQVLGIKES